MGQKGRACFNAGHEAWKMMLSKMWDKEIKEVATSENQEEYRKLKEEYVGLKAELKGHGCNWGEMDPKARSTMSKSAWKTEENL